MQRFTQDSVQSPPTKPVLIWLTFDISNDVLVLILVSPPTASAPNALRVFMSLSDIYLNRRCQCIVRCHWLHESYLKLGNHVAYISE